MLDYSVFIPVYNEAAILADNARRLMNYLDGLVQAAI